jgi:hypothetical protein
VLRDGWKRSPLRLRTVFLSSLKESVFSNPR